MPKKIKINDSKPRSIRHKDWPRVRREHLKSHGACAACGRTVKKELEVHHVRPVHLFPELELDPDNLITLCEGVHDCHHRIGHSFDWHAWNPLVREDCDLQLIRIETRKTVR